MKEWTKENQNVKKYTALKWITSMTYVSVIAWFFIAFLLKATAESAEFSLLVALFASTGGTGVLFFLAIPMILGVVGLLLSIISYRKGRAKKGSIVFFSLFVLLPYPTFRLLLHVLIVFA